MTLNPCLENLIKKWIYSNIISSLWCYAVFTSRLSDVVATKVCISTLFENYEFLERYYPAVSSTQ